MNTATVVLESPLARGMRSFMSAAAASPAIIALLLALSKAGADFTTIRDGLVPAGVALLNAVLLGGVAVAAGYSERWRALTETPFRKGVAQGLQYIVVGAAGITIVSLDPDVIVSVGESIGALVAGAALSGLITFGLNAFQQKPVDEPTPPVAN